MWGEGEGEGRSYSVYALVFIGSWGMPVHAVDMHIFSYVGL